MTTGYTYDEFGNLARSGAQDFLNEVTFTGSVSDTASGLQYMNARFYNPNTGRFLSQDTYSGSAWDPWTQHLYAYCGNNPVNMIDPTGHSAWLIILGLLTAWGTAVASQPDVAYDIDFLAIDLANEDYGSAALDALGLAIPCVTGLGQIDNLVSSSIRASDKVIDTSRAAGRLDDVAAASSHVIDDIFDASTDISKTSDNLFDINQFNKSMEVGWHPGDDITKLTRAGNEPKWSTVRQRYWKNEALLNPMNYVQDDITRMKTGLAPKVKNPITGLFESMELHHIIPQRTGLPNIHTFDNLMPITPKDHAVIDRYRYINGG